MNLFVCGWNVSSELSEIITDALTTSLHAFPQLDPETLWYQSNGGMIAGSVHHSAKSLGSKSYVYKHANGITFFDGVMISRSKKFRAHVAADLHAHWDDLSGDLEGIYAAVRLLDEPRSLTIQNDFLGMKQLYYRQIGRTWLVSNNANLLSKIDSATDLDPLGVSYFLTLGWVGSDRTLNKDIRVVPGGQIWEWKDRDTAPRSRCFYPPHRLGALTPRAATREQALVIAGEIGSACKTMATQAGEMECGLTGGCDSRILAGILSKNGIDVDFVTYGEPDWSEARLASRVASALELKHRVDPTKGHSVEDSWDEIVPKFIEQTDGMTSLWQVRVVLDQSKSIDQLNTYFYGTASEIGRGFYLEPKIVFRNPTKAAMQDFMVERLLHYAVLPVRKEAVNEVTSFIREFVESMLDHGVAIHNVPDMFYTFERHRRWVGNVLRPQLLTKDMYQPYHCRAYIESCFETTLLDRYRSRIHQFLLDSLQPELKSIGFSRDPALAPRFLGDLKRWIALHLPRHIVQKRRHRFAMQLGWVENALPSIREICLDQSNSTLWDYIERDVFDSITSPETETKNRIQHTEQILHIATLFYRHRALGG